MAAADFHSPPTISLFFSCSQNISICQWGVLIISLPWIIKSRKSGYRSSLGYRDFQVVLLWTVLECMWIWHAQLGWTVSPRAMALGKGKLKEQKPPHSQSPEIGLRPSPSPAESFTPSPTLKEHFWGCSPHCILICFCAVFPAGQWAY